MNILSKAFFIIFGVFLIIILGRVAYQNISPLFLPIEAIGRISFSYIPLPFMAVFGFFTLVSSLFFILFPLKLIRGQKKESVKWFYLPMVLGALIGICVNYANYYYVIKPNNMIECPKNIGYKKNLMRDYVTDLSLCEKL